MSNNTDQEITAQACANALAGERSYMQISFPVTGDKQLDFMSAVLVLANELKLEAAQAELACKYLQGRFNAIVVDYAKAMNPWNQMAGLQRAAQQRAAITGTTGAPTPYSYSQLANSLSSHNNLGGFDMPPVYDPAICKDPAEPISFTQKIIDRLKSEHSAWKQNLHGKP